MCGMTPCDLSTCTWSLQHRLECEARMVMNMTDADRDTYLAGVKEKRGAQCREEVLARAREEWRKKRRQEIEQCNTV